MEHENGFGGWSVSEALKWADTFGTWKDEAIDGNALALNALAKEVRRLLECNKKLEADIEGFIHGPLQPLQPL